MPEEEEMCVLFQQVHIYIGSFSFRVAYCQGITLVLAGECFATRIDGPHKLYYRHMTLMTPTSCAFHTLFV